VDGPLMLDRLQPGHTDKTYLSIHLLVFELLGVHLRKHVSGQVVSEFVGLFVVDHDRLGLCEHSFELLAVATYHLFVVGELGLQLGPAFDGNRRLHQHPAQDMLVYQRVKI